MANFAQHGNNIKLVDEVNRGVPKDNTNDKDLLGADEKDKKVDDEE